MKFILSIIVYLTSSLALAHAADGAVSSYNSNHRNYPTTLAGWSDEDYNDCKIKCLTEADFEGCLSECLPSDGAADQQAKVYNDCLDKCVTEAEFEGCLRECLNPSDAAVWAAE